MTGPSTKRAAYETARLQLARVRLESTAALGAGLALTTQIVADALSVDRVGIWFLEDRDRRLSCKEMFVRASREHRSGAELSAREYPTYMRALRERRAIVADDARAHATTRELAETYLIPNDIASLLDAPIIRGGRVIGVVCHERVGAVRAWTEREIDFAGSAADMVALVLEQADRVELEAALKLEAEQRLERQKLEALALMARSVAHDLNNVLAVVLATADEVDEDGLRQAAEALRSAVQSGKRLSRQLLDVGGKPEREPAVLDVGKALQRLLGSLRGLATSRVQVSLQVRDRDPRAQVDEDGFERIIFNLVANARDAISGPGQVQVVVRAAEDADELAPDFLVLEVSDDGCGMDARTQSHLFEPYFTTKAEGHGLGLASVYGIVKRAGGSIEVASAPGEGTRFKIALRRAS